jgi:YidC/Oxa1 family membrane protein insertase
MPDIIDAVLWPIKWTIEALLAFLHGALVQAGLSGNAGVTWLLSIVILLVVVRLIVLPLSIASIKNSQKMVLLTDKLIEVRARYKGVEDIEAHQRKSDELRAHRRSTDANQLKSLIPQLIQVPIFFALYSVLRTAQADRPGVGLFTARLARSFGDAEIFDVPFKASLLGSHGATRTIILGVVITLIVAICQFVSQALTLRYNITDQARKSPIWRFRPTPLFVAPPVLIVTSLAVPFGLLFYLGASSVWTLVQQGCFLLRYPLPTTDAHAARQGRIRKKADARSEKVMPGEEAGLPESRSSSVK